MSGTDRKGGEGGAAPLSPPAHRATALTNEETKTMKRFLRSLFRALIVAAGATLSLPAGAVAFVQCPEDQNHDGRPARDLFDVVIDVADADLPTVKCMHLTGGDGWITMGDGREVYMFGFSDVSRLTQSTVLDKGVFRSNSPAPTIRVREGDEFYLTLTNVGTFNRPDLFDPHTVHYHGFPNASAIFDGLPESAIAINQQASITYYYNNVEPGTYMWHCHVEATEHMQMGMLGNLYVDPIQNQTGIGGTVQVPHNATKAGKEGGAGPYGYVYNDGDGSTAFDKEYVIQLQALYHVFRDASRDVQPLPFAEMRDTYLTINGRGYPHTTIDGPLHDCAGPNANPDLPPCPENHPQGAENNDQVSPQPVSALITANVGQKVLLRMSNLGVVSHYTITVLGIPMKVVGRGARLLRGQGQAAGANVYYDTNVVNLGGGESTDVILDTANVAPGRYFLYATNLNFLSNNEEDVGGYMTEIVIN
jgi:FtsP/CotA-like multicopper oxidase with cupredoxin domain